MSVNPSIRKMVMNLINAFDQQFGINNSKNKANDALSSKNQNGIHSFIGQIQNESAKVAASDFQLKDKKPNEIKKFLEQRFELKIDAKSIAGKVALILAIYAYGILVSSTRKLFCLIGSRLNKESAQILMTALSIILQEKQEDSQRELTDFLRSGDFRTDSPKKKYCSIKELIDQLIKLKKIKMKNSRLEIGDAESVNKKPSESSQRKNNTDESQEESKQTINDVKNTNNVRAIESEIEIISPIGSQDDIEDEKSLEKIEKLQKRLIKLEKLHQEDKNQIITAEKELFCAQEREKELKWKFEDKISNLEKLCSQYKSSNEELTKENQYLQLELNGQRSFCETNDVEVRELKNKISSLEEALDSSRKSLTSKDEKMDSFRKEMSSMKDNLEQNDRKIRSLVHDKESLEGKLKWINMELREKVKAAKEKQENETRDKFVSKLNAIESKLANRDQTIAEMSNQREDLEKKLKASELKVEEMRKQDDREALIAKVAQLEEELNPWNIVHRESFVENIERKMASMKTELKQRESKINSLEIKLKLKESEIRDEIRLVDLIQARKVKAEYEIKLSVLQSKLKEKEEMVGRLVAAHDDLEGKLKEKEEKIERFEQDGDREMLIEKNKKMEESLKSALKANRQCRINKAERERELMSSNFWLQRRNEEFSIENSRLELIQEKMRDITRKMELQICNYERETKILKETNRKLNLKLSKIEQPKNMCCG